MLRTVKSTWIMSLVAVMFATLTANAASAATTLDNLMAAYKGEMNAHARYLGFARQADKEGYTQVGSLFRAAAGAEFIHAENHADVIRSLGGTAEASVASPEVKSTKENLKAAIEGESHERDTMYPQFIEQARRDRNRDAMKSFNFARTAEASHAKFYQQALDNLEAWRGGKKNFYVCEVCGETLTDLPSEKCPSCFSPREEFRMVN